MIWSEHLVVLGADGDGGGTAAGESVGALERGHLAPQKARKWGRETCDGEEIGFGDGGSELWEWQVQDFGGVLGEKA